MSDSIPFLIISNKQHLIENELVGLMGAIDLINVATSLNIEVNTKPPLLPLPYF